MVSSVNGASIVKSLTNGNMDIQQLATDLTNATRAPQQALIDARRTAAESKISSIGKIQASAKSFQDSLAEFGDARALPLTPTTSDTSIADFSFKSFFTPGPVDVSFKVNQLASENRTVFSKIATSGSLNLGGTTVNYTDLLDLRSKINATAGYSATLVNGSDLIVSKGTGASNVFTATASVTAAFTSTGAGNPTATLSQITGAGTLTLPGGSPIAFTDAAHLANQINTGVGAPYSATSDANGNVIVTTTETSQTGSITFTRTQTTSGIDAIIEANGQTYSSASNRFDNLIVGVTINVKKTSSSEVRLSTARNTDLFVMAAQTIVDGFNSLMKSITSEIQYDPDVKKRGGLANDFVARGFMNQLRSLTTQPISNYGATGKSYTLADIGIMTNRDGTWTLNPTKIEAIAQDNPEILEAVVATDTNSQGILDRMKKLTATALDNKEAFQTLANKTKNTDLAKAEEELAKLDEQMTALQNRYLTQFTAMQSKLYEAQNTQSSLTNFMTAWTAGLKNG